jgi:hypothetical protein
MGSGAIEFVRRTEPRSGDTGCDTFLLGRRGICFGVFPQPVKSCPDTNRSEAEFFSGLFSRADKPFVFLPEPAL